ncbi:hypothetical protein TRSC58_00709 [Trypanosoma rangeli SC58]|uniref:Uncharacterized protein n=1 Tax=Trypanosoma rangeli SC58 TaxID=429131 RepID=A0A061JDS5_TRYRA|nr:hypothetical protein TRSC58_00709 [Trypanosoma rangeli SC58]
METADLVKTLLKADEECRILRDRVALLEKTHRLRERDARALTATPSGVAADSKKTRARTLTLPLEAVSMLSSKAGDINMMVKEQKKLLEELKQLQTILESSAADTVRANELNTQLKQRIGYTEGETIFHLQDAIKEVAQVNGLKNEILQLLSAREAVQATLKRQTEHMRAYLTELVASRSLDEQREEAEQQLKEKKAELEGIREEIQSMQRLLERKEKQLENEKPVDELQLAQRAENERRMMIHRLEKEEEGIRQNEISIRHRSMQITKLERRIEMIGDTLGCEGPNEERVDAEIVEQLRKEILVLGRRHQKREAQQEILDASIVDLDRRCTGLVRTTANVKKEMQRIQRNHRKYLNLQKKELELEQMTAEQEIGEIEREIEMLRHTTSRRGQKAQNSRIHQV